jgi:hypothetical protein
MPLAIGFQNVFNLSVTNSLGRGIIHFTYTNVSRSQHAIRY